MRPGRLAPALAMAFVALGPLFVGEAQAQIPRGSLRGVVQDASGGRVPAANIQVAATGSSAIRRATSNERGEFRIEDLRAGRYRVTVVAPGFADAQAEVTITIGAVRDIVVTLVPRVAGETVSVRGRASSITTRNIDLGTTVHQSAVTAEDLETIPLAARSFANIAYLAPGTEPLEPSDPTKARITAVSTGGSSGLNNALSVDGADNSDDYIGGFLQNISPDAIQEFAVRTAQEDADTGGTTAGSFIITTKQGTSTWHGQAGLYERAAALNARFPIENPARTCTSQGCVNNPKQPFSRQNYTGTLGGPIEKDKLWVFGSLEIVRENASIAYSPASTTQFNALAALAAQRLIPGVSSIPVPQNVSIPFRDYNGSLRLDWQPSQDSHWFLRLSGDNYRTHNALVQQGSLPSTGLTTHNTYWNAVLSNQASFGSWLGSLVLGASYLHLTQERNGNLGFALAFPFTSTSQTVSGFETFGDNQFHTPITAFPAVRNQEKYQLRYDLSHTTGHHSFKFGLNFIHEPVLSGTFASTPQDLTVFVEDPSLYTDLIQSSPAAGAAQFRADLTCIPVTIQDPSAGAVTIQPTLNTSCSFTPGGNGSFSQSVRRLALYTQDSWRVTRNLTLNYGLRYQTTFGLFIGSGRSQLENPAYLTLQALQIPLLDGAAHDDRRQIAPRLGVAYSPGDTGHTVFRAGIGLFYNDLAQVGWATAFQTVNQPTGPCRLAQTSGTYVLQGAGCILGGSASTGQAIGSNYKTPYAVHVTAGIQHSPDAHWTLGAEYTHESGYHGYRAYSYSGGTNLLSPVFPQSDASDQQALVPNITIFNSDNRSAYDALTVHLQGNVARHFSLIAHYTLSRAKTWGCVLGELFDYVNGVCDPLNPFAPGDYGPSGEDVTHRFVLAGTLHAPGGIQVATLAQAESARPFTITTADGRGRISIDGVPEGLDVLRGTPFIQVDLRVSRPFKLSDRVLLNPFIDFFNVFNRNNSGANYVTNVARLPVPPDQAQAGSIRSICLDAGCSTVAPIRGINQVRVPAGALGDFFGPGTTVGIPFAAQLGVRLSF